jgi:hypothetical protein
MKLTSLYQDRVQYREFCDKGYELSVTVITGSYTDDRNQDTVVQPVTCCR